MAIKQVYHEYKEANDFRRISQYFDGKENRGKRFIARTQPNAYGGYYFVIRLNDRVSNLPQESQVKLAVILPQQPEPKVYKLTVPQNESRSCEIYAGITGSDWADPLQTPIAWRIMVYDNQKKLLAEQHSFLWNDDMHPIFAEDH